MHVDQNITYIMISFGQKVWLDHKVQIYSLQYIAIVYKAFSVFINLGACVSNKPQ